VQHSPTQPLAAYLDTWLQLQRSQLQPSTWVSYRSNIECYLKPGLGDVALGELTPRELSTFYAQLQLHGRQRGAGPLSLRTVQYCHGVLHKALADAVRLEIVPRNVAHNATLPRIDLRGDGMREIRCWNAQQLRRFLAHTAGSPLQPLWHLAAATGMRRGELLGLRWDDVDLSTATLTVRRALSVINDDVRLKQPKTSRCRTLRIDPQTAEVLARVQREQRRHRDRAAGWRNDWNLVFTHLDGQHLDPRRISYLFRIAVRDAPVPPIRLHDLRHTHATLLLQAEVPAKVVSERLGHAQITLTLDIYAHVLPAMDADAADRFAAAVFPDG
jgi:integrase